MVYNHGNPCYTDRDRGDMMSLKEELLRYLEEHREAPVSGQLLAERLSVSRAAVWKAVKSLEEEGHRITAATNRGYQLEAASDVLTAQGVRCHLSPAYRDCAVLVERRVGSTNTQAKKLAADGAGGRTILLADEQTAGRGRMGRGFYSPARTGVYMSLLLRPETDSAQLPIITVAAAAAVCEAIEALTGLETQVKWVNDVLVGGRKVCGILTEAVSDFESGRTESVIVGIGVNVKTPPALFPAELREIAGSLLPASVSRNRLAAEIANRLFDYVADLPGRAYLEPYRRRLMVLGKRVRFYREGAWQSGRAVGLDGDGCLEVETPSGAVLLRAGEIRMEGEPI